MNGRDPAWTIRPIPELELQDALALVVAASGADGHEIERNVQAFSSYSATTAVVGTSHWGAYQGETLLAVSLCFDHPGRAGLVFVPALEASSHLVPVVADLLRTQADAAERRGLCLLQVILEPGQRDTEAVLSKSSYEFLADLLYLECEVVRPATPSFRAGLRWRTYAPDTHDLFVRTIGLTYCGSMDCPRLVGRRSMEDIIAGHKGAGRFDPGHWVLAEDDQGPVGVLLLSKDPKQRNAEIVYMGVVPVARGRKMGTTLLHVANERAFQAHAECLTLAVDAANTPALRMYESFGFAERIRRRAWVRFLPPRPA